MPWPAFGRRATRSKSWSTTIAGRCPNIGRCSSRSEDCGWPSEPVGATFGARGIGPAGAGDGARRVFCFFKGLLYASHQLTHRVRRVVHRFRVGMRLLDRRGRSEEHTSELQSQSNLVCRLLLEKKKKTK